MGISTRTLLHPVTQERHKLYSQAWSMETRMTSVDLSIRATLREYYEAGGCPKIEAYCKKSGFWPIFPIKFVQYNKYSPHLIEKMNSKPLSLATASILGQPPRDHHSKSNGYYGYSQRRSSTTHPNNHDPRHHNKDYDRPGK